LQNGQSVPLQQPATPTPGASIPDWQQGLGLPTPGPYQPQQQQLTPAVSAPTTDAPSVGMPATPAVQSQPIYAAQPQPDYHPSSQPPLPGRPAAPAYSVEQPSQPEVNQPQPVWQPPAAAAPNEISMPSAGVAAYQRPAPARTVPIDTTDYQQIASANARSNRKPLLIIAVTVVAMLLFVGAYFVFFRKGNGATDNTSQQSTQTANSLAALESATLMPPQTIDGYVERSTGTGSVRDFISSDGNCELIIGTVSAGQLPGKDLTAIIKPQLDQLKSAGAKVEGPKDGTALKLKDAKDSSKTYDVPTLTFTFTQDSNQASTHYSAVIMKNGDRAVLNRTCHKDGNVDENKLKALDATVNQVIVQPATKQ
jgi:hypothetical protein